MASHLDFSSDDRVCTRYCSLRGREERSRRTNEREREREKFLSIDRTESLNNTKQSPISPRCRCISLDFCDYRCKFISFHISLCSNIANTIIVAAESYFRWLIPPLPLAPSPSLIIKLQRFVRADCISILYRYFIIVCVIHVYTTHEFRDTCCFFFYSC